MLGMKDRIQKRQEFKKEMSYKKQNSKKTEFKKDVGYKKRMWV